MYDLIIVGGGPAAIAGGIYAARKQLKTKLLAKEFGGQSVVSPLIHNWIGTPSISGSDLAKSLVAHLKEYEGEFLSIEEGVPVLSVSGKSPFTVTLKNGASYEAKTVLIATGAQRRKLTVKGAQEFDQKGLTYCATCDGPLFSGMDVAVIGGGNAGFETAAQLLAYTKSVTLLDASETFRADAVTVEKVLSRENMRALPNVEVLEILGERMVQGVSYKDKKSGKIQTLHVTGVFVEIGSEPNTKLVHGMVELDDCNNIKVDARTQRTSTEGIWAAGDCTDCLYEQNNIAVGDAVKAIEDIYVYLKA